MDIFIIREGRQAGPYNEDAVKAFLAEGTARMTDMGWRKGMADWRALSEVLKAQPETSGQSVTPPPADAHGTNGSADTHVAATAKQKTFLKYLGAEFGENLTKDRAALAISDALETPKLQTRIRKWQDEKLRQHPGVFQDEIDFRKTNRSNRYLERIQTEGSEVLKDVTKAHVQVLVESLDKRHPGWESERESAVWDYLLPAVGEHFPQLVRPAYQGRLKLAGAAKIGSAATRGLSATAGTMMPPAATTGTLGAMMRGVALGVIALGAIVVGRQYLQKTEDKGAVPITALPAPSAPGKNETSPAAKDPVSKVLAAQPPEKRPAEGKAPDAAPENPPTPAVPEPAQAPALVAPNEPAPATLAMNAEKPPAPAAPEEKPAAQAPATPPAAPSEPTAMNTPAAAPPPRTAVKLMQGIGVMLSNGQVTLPAGTPLRYLGTEGTNVRVSWNNNVFFVPALATDVNEPVPAPAEPATMPPVIGAEPARPAAPAAPKPKKPADDL